MLLIPVGNVTADTELTYEYGSRTKKNRPSVKGSTDGDGMFIIIMLSMSVGKDLAMHMYCIYNIYVSVTHKCYAFLCTVYSTYCVLVSALLQIVQCHGSPCTGTIMIIIATAKIMCNCVYTVFLVFLVLKFKESLVFLHT